MSSKPCFFFLFCSCSFFRLLSSNQNRSQKRRMTRSRSCAPTKFTFTSNHSLRTQSSAHMNHLFRLSCIGALIRETSYSTGLCGEFHHHISPTICSVWRIVVLQIRTIPIYYPPLHSKYVKSEYCWETMVFDGIMYQRTATRRQMISCPEKK